MSFWVCWSAIFDRQVCRSPFGLRDSLTSIFYVSPMGEAHPYLYKIVEERTVVRIANRDTIVRIQRTRASIAPIVDISEGSETTQTRLRSSTYNYVIANAKVMKNSDTTSQRAIFFIFFRLRHIKIWRDRLRRSVLKCSYAIHIACVSQSSSASQRNAPQHA